MSHLARVCSLLLLILAVLVGCGSDDSSGEGTPQEGSASQEATTPKATATPKKDSSRTTKLDITFKGDTVDPQGAEIKIKAGKPLELRIVADEPGELHVHSSPEQEIEYPAGTSEKTLTLDQPGVVDLESHDLELLVAQLEVR